jgi:hypothetical protein
MDIFRFGVCTCMILKSGWLHLSSDPDATKFNKCVSFLISCCMVFLLFIPLASHFIRIYSMEILIKNCLLDVQRMITFYFLGKIPYICQCEWLMASHMWHTDDIWDYEVLEVFFRVCLASSLCQTSPKNMWPNIAIYQSLITNNMTNYNCRRGPKLYMPNVWQWCKLTRRRLAWMAQINISPGSKISGAQGESKNWGLFYINNFFHPWYTYIFLLKKLIVY